MTLPFRRLDWALLLITYLVSSYVITTSTNHLSATFDEPFYLDAGLTAWRTGSNKMLMKAGTMPLPVDLQTLPLHVTERLRGTPYDPARDFGEMLTTSRRMTLIFWFALLAYGMRLGSILGGPIAGRTSLLFLATEPNLLAHAGLATTDVAVTAGVLAATVHFLTGRNGPWQWRVLVSGVAYGVALLSKASALAFVPLIWGVLTLHNAIHSTAPGLGGIDRIRHAWHTTAGPRLDFVGQFLIAMAVTFAYCGSDWQPERTFVEWANQLPSGSMRDVMKPVSERLTIFTNAGEALAQQVKHNARGHGAFLLGEWHPRAVWYYFPVALAVKLTGPALLLIAGAIIFRTRGFFGPAGWVVMALIVFSFTCRVQIGLRLVFPLVAFALIATAVAWAKQPTAKLRLAILGVAIAAQALCTGLAGSDRLGYFNELVGPGRGGDILSDSNVDWGQGLLALDEWSRDHKDETGRGVSLVYFGTDPRVDSFAFRKLPVERLGPISAAELRSLIGTDDLAISPTLLTGRPLPPPLSTVIEFTRGLTPVARAGPYPVYRLP